MPGPTGPVVVKVPPGDVVVVTREATKASTASAKIPIMKNMLCNIIATRVSVFAVFASLSNIGTSNELSL